MLTVLDSWALLAYLKGEPAAPVVERQWTSGAVAMCSVNLGEALYMRTREVGESAARAGVAELRAHMRVVDPDWPLVDAAAAIKARGGLSYADAFCIATAQRLEAPLWTGDPEIVEAGRDLDVDVVDLRTAAAGPRDAGTAAGPSAE